MKNKDIPGLLTNLGKKTWLSLTPFPSQLPSPVPDELSSPNMNYKFCQLTK